MHTAGTRIAARAAVSISLAGVCVLLVGLALVSSASASSRIAFVKGNSRTTIWTVAANGKDPRQLTKGKRYDFSPAWSPKRGMIAFVQYPSAKNQHSQLWLMRADGTHQRRLTYSGPSLTGTGVLAYSSNGRLLAGGCKLAGQNKWAITVLNLKTRKSHIIHRFSCQLFDGVIHLRGPRTASSCSLPSAPATATTFSVSTSSTTSHQRPWPWQPRCGVGFVAA